MFLFLNATCSKRDAIPSPPAPDPSDIIEPASSKITARIYIDASASMKGFVSPGTWTNYAQILPYFETVILNGWSNSKADFYGFGEEVLKLESRGHLDAVKSNFYAGRETNIQNVLECLDTNCLTVIITDLFPSDNDLAQLIKLLKPKYINNGFSIGILGLRSQFDGIVYDTNIYGGAFPYKNGEGIGSYRPFYLLILGKHTDVVRYFEKLKMSCPSIVSESNFIIFSRHLVSQLSSFEWATINSKNNLLGVRSLVTRNTQDKRFEQFRIRDRSKNASFVATFKYSPLPYTVPFSPRNLEAVVAAQKWQQKKGEFEQNAEFAKGFRVEKLEISNSELNLVVEINPKLLTGSGIYLYEITIRPNESSYKLPSWFTNWDMGSYQDGSGTRNLNYFLSNLWLTNVQIHQPKIAKFYCYIQK